MMISLFIECIISSFKVHGEDVTLCCLELSCEERECSEDLIKVGIFYEIFRDQRSADVVYGSWIFSDFLSP